MIIDRIENINIYSSLGERISKALKYISETDFTKLEKGKYPIDGDLVYALVNEYQTKEEADCKLETHQKYIDVQYMVSGEEVMGLALLTNQIPTEAYNEEKDCAFYTESVSHVKFDAGMFAIFFPHDLHQPCIRAKKESSVKKIVIKVKL